MVADVRSSNISMTAEKFSSGHTFALSRAPMWNPMRGVFLFLSLRKRFAALLSAEEISSRITRRLLCDARPQTLRRERFFSISCIPGLTGTLTELKSPHRLRKRKGYSKFTVRPGVRRERRIALMMPTLG